MEVRVYHDARAFLEEYEMILLEHESISQLVLYSAYQCEKNNIKEDASFGCVIKSGKPQLFFSNVLPFHMAMYLVPDVENDASALALADYFGNRHIQIGGIVGKFHVCREFMEEYRRLTSYQFTPIWGMDLMELRELNEISLIGGTHRLALPEEGKLVAEWMIDFQLEAFTMELDYQAARERADKLVDEGKVYFYENHESNVVTMAIATRKIALGTTITYVFTPEEYRGNGYAAANIYCLSKELFEQGNEFCTLFVDKKNPLSGRAYEKLGYKVIDEIYEYRLVPVF